uniref:Uncharacterized protein n=1 Tax=Glossina pallidipes TaxID=7398 RepID=A0A1B0AD31_GLOPL
MKTYLGYGTSVDLVFMLLGIGLTDNTVAELIGSNFTLLLELLLLVVEVVVDVHATEVKISDGVFDFVTVIVELVSAKVDGFFEVDDEGDVPTRSAKSSGNRRDGEKDCVLLL